MPLLTLLALLALLGTLSKLPLHLLLELLRLALQHLLLPFLLGSLGAVTLLLGQSLLALGEFVELLQRVVDFLGPLFGGRSSRGLLGLILIFLGVELEVEQGSQIARRAAATAASTSTARSEGNLNTFPVGGFGAL